MLDVKVAAERSQPRLDHRCARGGVRGQVDGGCRPFGAAAQAHGGDESKQRRCRACDNNYPKDVSSSFAFSKYFVIKSAVLSSVLTLCKVKS